MTVTDFAAVAEEFHRRVAKTIWCTLAAVDTRGRSRTRIVHPVGDGPSGWLGSRAGTPKLAHLAAHADVSLLSWDPDHEQVTIDAPIWPGGPEGDDFVAIRLVAHRIAAVGAHAVGTTVWQAPVRSDQESPS